MSETSNDVSRPALPTLPHRVESGASCEVWIVRHGERYDEVPGNDWYETCGESWLDPPLTARGQVQAEDAALALEARLRETQTEAAAEPLFDAIFSSPLQRCISTAAPFSRIFGLPIRPVPGLAECAAALQGKAASKDAWATARLPLLCAKQLRELCPDAAFLPEDEVVEPFISRDGVCAAARLTEGRRRILIVTHREGIRDLTALAGTPVRKTPYCCIASFSFARGTCQWSFHGILATDDATHGKSGPSRGAAHAQPGKPQTSMSQNVIGRLAERLAAAADAKFGDSNG
jgi:broad specificity phosphatase PhoE